VEAIFQFYYRKGNKKVSIIYKRTKKMSPLLHPSTFPLFLPYFSHYFNEKETENAVDWLFLRGVDGGCGDKIAFTIFSILRQYTNQANILFPNLPVKWNTIFFRFFCKYNYRTHPKPLEYFCKKHHSLSLFF